jgi:hypothetical protein
LDAGRKKLLGTTADVEIARRLGEEGTVYQMRRSLEIPATRHLKLWAKEEDRLLGILPDAELARPEAVDAGGR